MINGENVIGENIQVQNYNVLKMQKKIFSKLGKLKWVFLLGLIFTCILLCSQTSVKATRWTDPSNGVVYEYTPDLGTAYVSGFMPSLLIADVVIPKIITPVEGGDSYKVDEIGEAAFILATSLETIDIQAEIRTIGLRAFIDCSLKSAKIPVNLDTLSVGVFFNCVNLEKVVFYGRLQKYKNLIISGGAFAFCPKLQQICLPLNVSDVGKGAFFSNNDGQVSVILPSHVSSVDERAFATPGIRTLSSLVVMNKDTIFDPLAFDNNTVTNLIARTGHGEIPITYTNLKETPFFVTFNQQYDGLYDVAGVLHPEGSGPYQVAPPTDPSRANYTFEGWYKEPNCINMWDFDNDLVTDQDVILYAGWLLTDIPTQFTYWVEEPTSEQETLKCVSASFESSTDILKISGMGFVPGDTNDLIGLVNNSSSEDYIVIFVNGANRIMGTVPGAGGDSLPIPDMAPSLFGKGDFIGWQNIGGPGTIDGSNVNINNGNTVFKATYGEVLTFEISGDTNITISPSGSIFSFGDTLTIECTDKENCYSLNFKDEPVSLSNHFKFIVTDSGRFSYTRGVPTPIKDLHPVASLGSVNYDSDTQKLTFIAQRSVPLTYDQVVDSGVLLLQADEEPASWDLNTPGVLRFSRPQTNNAFGSVVVSKCGVADATKWYGKAYVIAKQTASSPDDIRLSESKHS